MLLFAFEKWWFSPRVTRGKIIYFWLKISHIKPIVWKYFKLHAVRSRSLLSNTISILTVLPQTKLPKPIIWGMFLNKCQYVLLWTQFILKKWIKFLQYISVIFGLISLKSPFNHLSVLSHNIKLGLQIIFFLLICNRILSKLNTSSHKADSRQSS